MTQPEHQDRPAAKNPRETRVSATLEHRLSMYALAASAAGTGMLAWAQPADAKIVYTPANVSIPPQTYYPPVFLDVNHDGVNDFSFVNYSAFNFKWGNVYLEVFPLVKGNGFRGQKGCASALRAGDRIGAQGQFAEFGQNLAAFSSYHSSQKNTSHFFCAWANDGKGLKNRYLGLRFLIKGETHFGWARLNVRVKEAWFYGTLTGYAYETVPNKPIIAGKTKGPDASTLEPGALGHLTLGASAISAWRGEESAVGTQ